MNDTKETLYLAMARGIFMGLADMGDMDALFPEVKGDWRGALDNPEKVQKLANLLRDAQTCQPPRRHDWEGDLGGCVALGCHEQCYLIRELVVKAWTRFEGERLDEMRLLQIRSSADAELQRKVAIGEAQPIANQHQIIAGWNRFIQERQGQELQFFQAPEPSKPVPLKFVASLKSPWDRRGWHPDDLGHG